MEAGVAGAFALAIAFVLFKHKKWPKVQLTLILGGVSSLLGGVVADYVRDWTGQIDKAIGGWTEDAVGAKIPALGLVAFVAFLFLLFALLPRARPKPNVIWLAALLPVIAPAIPGRAGDATTKIVGGVNAATTSVMGGIFGDGPSPGQPKPKPKPGPKHTDTVRPSTPPHSTPAG
jgi:hypothetical protein